MKFAVFFAFAVLALADFGDADLAQCPDVPTIANFDANKFAGVWYSVYESSPPRLPCLHYNQVVSSNGGYNTTFLPYGITLQTMPKSSANLSAGFTLKMSLPLLDGANFNIFDTDYTSYAGVYTCKITADKDFRSVTLWSRTKTLSDATVNSLKAKITSYGGDPSSLQAMTQSNYFPVPCSAMNLLTPVLAAAAAGITDVASLFN